MGLRHLCRAGAATRCWAGPASLELGQIAFAVAGATGDPDCAENDNFPQLEGQVIVAEFGNLAQDLIVTPDSNPVNLAEGVIDADVPPVCRGH